MRADLTGTLHDVASLLGPEAGRAGVRLRSAVASGLRVDADPAELQDALSAALRDSLQAAPPGGEVWLTADRESDTCTVRLSSPAPWAGKGRGLLAEAVRRANGQMRSGPTELLVRLGRI